jgi:hypothetical protein
LLPSDDTGALWVRKLIRPKLQHIQLRQQSEANQVDQAQTLLEQTLRRLSDMTNRT